MAKKARKPSAADKLTAEQKQALSWETLLKEVVEQPALLSSAYQSFHDYSVGNQLLGMIQARRLGIDPGPMASYRRWQELGRQVGHEWSGRSIILWHPATFTKVEQDDEGNDVERKFTAFRLGGGTFVLDQTTGAEYKPVKVGKWNPNKAIVALKVAVEKFTMTDGNCLGYARDNTIALNPVNPHPTKTLVHELAHIVLKHTVDDATFVDGEKLKRNEKEMEAESVAYIVMNALGYDKKEDIASCRAYVQHWYGKDKSIPESNARRIFSAANAIIKAGLPPKPERKPAPAK